MKLLPLPPFRGQRYASVATEELLAADRRLERIAQDLERHKSLEGQVNELWDFIRRRAYAEAIQQGLLERNSPARLTKKGKKAFAADPLLSTDLRKFYQEEGYQMPEPQLFKEIERRFGDRIVVSVCIPLGIHEGSCLLAAIHFCREDPLA